MMIFYNIEYIVILIENCLINVIIVGNKSFCLNIFYIKNDFLIYLINIFC